MAKAPLDAAADDELDDGFRPEMRVVEEGEVGGVHFDRLGEEEGRCGWWWLDGVCGKMEKREGKCSQNQ